jgi:hypothetical protein
MISTNGDPDGRLEGKKFGDLGIDGGSTMLMPNCMT